LEKVGGISLSNHLLSEAMGHSQLRQTNGKILLEISCISIVETRASHNVHSVNCVRLLLEQPSNQHHLKVGTAVSSNGEYKYGVQMNPAVTLSNTSR
jgi:hypothetical protein